MKGVHNTFHESFCPCKDCRLSRAIKRSLPYDSESTFLAFLARRGVAKFTSGVAGLCGTVAREIEQLEAEAELHSGAVKEWQDAESIRNGELLTALKQIAALTPVDGIDAVAIARKALQ